MIGLDTNILLRVVKTDPESPRQSELARKHVREVWERNESVFVSSVVLVECCWVLKSCYGTTKEGLITFVEYLLGLDLTKLEHPRETGLALDSFRKGKGDFSDYLIGHIGIGKGCEATWTFDKLLKEKSLFSQKKSK